MTVTGGMDMLGTSTLARAATFIVRGSDAGTRSVRCELRPVVVLSGCGLRRRGTRLGARRDRGADRLALSSADRAAQVLVRSLEDPEAPAGVRLEPHRRDDPRRRAGVGG